MITARTQLQQKQRQRITRPRSETNLRLRSFVQSGFWNAAGIESEIWGRLSDSVSRFTQSIRPLLEIPPQLAASRRTERNRETGVASHHLLPREVVGLDGGDGGEEVREREQLRHLAHRRLLRLDAQILHGRRTPACRPRADALGRVRIEAGGSSVEGRRGMEKRRSRPRRGRVCCCMVNG